MSIVIKDSKKTIFYVASLSTILIVLNYIYFNFNAPALTRGVPINKISSIVGLWIIAITAVHYNDARHSLALQKKHYNRTMEEIIFMTTHEVRNPVTNIVKIVEFMNEESVSNRNKDELMVYLRRSVEELESATRQMTDNICYKRHKDN